MIIRLPFATLRLWYSALNVALLKGLAGEPDGLLRVRLDLRKRKLLVPLDERPVQSCPGRNWKVAHG